MEFLKAMEIRSKICEGGEICTKCPLFREETADEESMNCDGLMRRHPEEFEDILAKWEREHKKTRQSELLKIFPNAKQEKNGTLAICPMAVEENFDRKYCENSECTKCCAEFWLTEVI